MDTEIKPQTNIFKRVKNAKSLKYREKRIGNCLPISHPQ
jgi:hypothetical protein